MQDITVGPTITRVLPEAFCSMAIKNLEAVTLANPTPRMTTRWSEGQVMASRATSAFYKLVGKRTQIS